MNTCARRPGVFDSRPAVPVLTVLVPLRNERESLPELYRRVVAMFDQQAMAGQLLLVDDGSTDGSAELIHELIRQDSRVGLLQLSRNFGKEAAMSAGIDHAEGDVVIVMDADLQDPPECIPQMLDAWRAGYDIVTMRRSRRVGESALRKACAWSFYRLLHALSEIEIPKDVGDFRLMSRQAVLALRMLPERNRYMKGLFAWVGMPSIELEFERPARAMGRSRWPATQLIGLAIDGITSFSVSPLRISGLCGVLVAIAAFFMALVYLFKTLVFGDPVQGFPSLMVAMLFLGGVQLISIGILGEYVGRIYSEVKRRPLYLAQTWRPPLVEPAAARVGDVLRANP